MIPLIKTAFDEAIASATSLNNQSHCLLHEETFSDLVFMELVREVECTSEGLLLHPMQDPKKIVRFFEEKHGLSFSRERRPNDTYDWVTAWPGPREFMIWVVAGEVFNMTGTVVNSKEQD
jgi:hypothetical protein